MTVGIQLTGKVDEYTSTCKMTQPWKKKLNDPDIIEEVQELNLSTVDKGSYSKSTTPSAAIHYPGPLKSVLGG
jgi:hypothetical protein